MALLVGAPADAGFLPFADVFFTAKGGKKKSEIDFDNFSANGTQGTLC